MLMRTRIAVTSVIVGLLLLATALVRYVTARDMQRQEPAAPQQEFPADVGLLACGAALVAGGVAALTPWSRPEMTTLAGMILLGAAGVMYLHARDVRRQEQAVLDRWWAEETRRATRLFPPALPRGRPSPTRLSGLPVSFACWRAVLCWAVVAWQRSCSGRVDPETRRSVGTIEGSASLGTPGSHSGLSHLGQVRLPY
jgi:hypothetical protein